MGVPEIVFWEEKCFGVGVAVRKSYGMMGVVRKVFWHNGNGKKCFGIMGMAIKVFWRSGRDHFTPSAAIKSEERFCIFPDFSKICEDFISGNHN